MHKRHLLASFVLALTSVLPLSSFAAYPDKPIRLVGGCTRHFDAYAGHTVVAANGRAFRD